jgi:hypothetical protein
MSILTHGVNNDIDSFCFTMQWYQWKSLVGVAILLLRHDEDVLTQQELFDEISSFVLDANFCEGPY